LVVDSVIAGRRLQKYFELLFDPGQAELGSIFDKTGASSRRELTAQIFYEHKRRTNRRLAH
jgi:hypothetical protein